MPKGTPRDPVPVNLVRPRVGTVWENRDGTVYVIETHTSFRSVNLENGPQNVPLEDFYKYYKAHKEEYS